MLRTVMHGEDLCVESLDIGQTQGIAEERELQQAILEDANSFTQEVFIC